MDKRGMAFLISMVLGAVFLGSVLPGWLGLATVHRVETSTSAKVYEGQPINLTEAERNKVVGLLLVDLKVQELLDKGYIIDSIEAWEFTHDDGVVNKMALAKLVKGDSHAYAVVDLITWTVRRVTEPTKP